MQSVYVLFTHTGPMTGHSRCVEGFKVVRKWVKGALETEAYPVGPQPYHEQVGILAAEA